MKPKHSITSSGGDGIIYRHSCTAIFVPHFTQASTGRAEPDTSGRAMEPGGLAAESPPEETAGDRGAAAVPARMTTVSRHYFGDAGSEHDHDLRVDIIENIEEDYGMFVWPCSIILAEYVWQQRSRFSSSSVVELGAGTSLPGLVAAKVGADVTLTDIAHNTEVLNNIRSMCELNDVNCRVVGLTWGDWDAPIFDLHPHIVLGADVLYDSKDFDDLFATVTFLLRSSPGAVFITTYHNRSGHHLIEFLMVKWGLKCSKLLDGFSFLPSRKAASLQGNIQLAEIILDKEQPK